MPPGRRFVAPALCGGWHAACLVLSSNELLPAMKLSNLTLSIALVAASLAIALLLPLPAAGARHAAVADPGAAITSQC